MVSSRPVSPSLTLTKSQKERPCSQASSSLHGTKEGAADATRSASSLSLKAGVSSQRREDDQRSLVVHCVSSTKHGGNLCAENSGSTPTKKRINTAACGTPHTPRTPLLCIPTNKTPKSNSDAIAQRSTKRLCRGDDNYGSAREADDDEEDDNNDSNNNINIDNNNNNDDDDEDEEEDYCFGTAAFITTPQNNQQWNAVNTYRNGTSAMVKALAHSGQIRNPSCYNAGNMAVEKLTQLKNSKHPQNYACVAGPKKGKFGLAGNGEVRDRFYCKDGDNSARLTIFDYEKQNAKQHEALMDSLHTILRNSHNIDPDNLQEMTLADAKELQENGLSFFAQFTFFCATTTADECRQFCGLNGILGVMKKLLLGGIETGLTEYFDRYSDWNVNRALQPDEGILGDTLDWVLTSCNQVSKAMDSLREELDGVSRYDPDGFDDSSGNEDMNESYTQYLCRVRTVVTAQSSWKPGIDSLIALTVLILNNVVGEGNMRDCFEVSPPEDDPYNHNLFSDAERAVARDNIESGLRVLEDSFGVELLDENTAAYANVDYDVHGHLQRRGWKHFCDVDVLNMSVYLFYRSDGTWPSMLPVHTAPCWMAPSQPDLVVTSNTIKSMRTTAVSMFGLGQIVNVLTTPNMEAFAFDPDPSKQSIFHHILCAHGLYTHQIVCFHFRRMSACLSLKNCLTPYEQNCYDKEYHGQSLDNPRVLSKRLRTKLRVRPDAMTQDMDFRWEAVNLLSNISSDPNDTSAQYWKDAALARLSYPEAQDIANNESITDKQVLRMKLYKFDKFMDANLVTGDLKQFFVDKRAELDHLWDTRRNERQESDLAEYRQTLAAGREAVANTGNIKMSTKAKERHNRLLSRIRK
eukprot:scaffold2809_cov119-Skeletonema_menzelii.AAC.4